MSSGRNNPAAPQDIAVQAVRKRPGKTGNDAIRHWDIKIFERNDYQLNHYSDDFPDDGKELAIAPGEVLDLSENATAGVLRWDMPAGEWTVIRYGMTSTGKRNQYASAGFRGGLCYDPLNRSGITAQWNDVAKPLIAIAKQNGGSLKFLHLDSWEMKLCNWTQGFEESFHQRRGYAMRPYLPVLAGHIVGNREISNRILEDFRHTVADLAAEENYLVLRDLAHAAGIALHMESAGPHQPPVDGLRTLGINDIPMGEAWARSTTHRISEPERMLVALGASAAHIYGKRFLAAEAPTSVGPVWERAPAEVKNVLDRSFCTGVNRINWHTYDSSPEGNFSNFNATPALHDGRAYYTESNCLARRGCAWHAGYRSRGSGSSGKAGNRGAAVSARGPGQSNAPHAPPCPPLRVRKYSITRVTSPNGRGLTLCDGNRPSATNSTPSHL